VPPFEVREFDPRRPYEITPNKVLFCASCPQNNTCSQLRGKELIRAAGNNGVHVVNDNMGKEIAANRSMTDDGSSMQISRTPLSCLLRKKIYGT